MAEREKADLLNDAASLARSDWMMRRDGARSVNLPFVGKLDSGPMVATARTITPRCQNETRQPAGANFYSKRSPVGDVSRSTVGAKAAQTKVPSTTPLI